MRIESLVPSLIKIYSILIISVIFIITFTEVNAVQNDILELAFLIRETMDESCDFATQETYMSKNADSNVAVRGNSYNIKSKDGNYTISGLFYDSLSYRDIMQSSQARQYIDHVDSEIKRKSTLAQYALKNNSYVILKDIMTGNENYTKYGITTANLGFTYLDKNVLTKIFKWRLANKLTTAGINKDDFRVRNTILTEDGTNYFIKWRGFRIYLNNIDIQVDNTNRIYVYNLNDSSDRDMYSRYTNISSSYYTYNGLPNEKDIRNYKIVYDIRWVIDIGYEGILPLALVYKAVQGNSSTTFDLTQRTDIKSVLGGSDFNTELGRISWDTSNDSNILYNAVNEGSLYVSNNYIPLAQKTIYTLIN